MQELFKSWTEWVAVAVEAAAVLVIALAAALAAVRGSVRVRASWACLAGRGSAGRLPGQRGRGRGWSACAAAPRQ